MKGMVKFPVQILILPFPVQNMWYLACKSLMGYESKCQSLAVKAYNGIACHCL